MGINKVEQEVDIVIVGRIACKCDIEVGRGLSVDSNIPEDFRSIINGQVGEGCR